jgi:hypothetical protein
MKGKPLTQVPSGSPPEDRAVAPDDQAVPPDHPPATSGPEQAAATGTEEPAATGTEEPAATGTEEPAATVTAEPTSLPPADLPPPPPGSSLPPPPPGSLPADALPPRPSRRGLKIALVAAAGVVVLAVAGVVLLIALLAGDDVPEVGQCMTHSDDPAEMAVVDCDDAEAVWRVIGNDGSWTERDFDQAPRAEVCQAFPEWRNALWLGEQTDDLSGEGEVVCLAPTGAGPPSR